MTTELKSPTFAEIAGEMAKLPARETAYTPAVKYAIWAGAKNNVPWNAVASYINDKLQPSYALTGAKLRRWWCVHKCEFNDEGGLR